MKPIRHLSLLGIVVAFSQPLSAQWTWTGASGPSWANLSNWSPGTLPDPGANITIADTTPQNIGNLSPDDRTVGSITVGTTGTRTSAFMLNTTTANTLNINGGIIANGSFTGIGARFRGNYKITANQTVQVGGEAGSHSTDRGIVIQCVTDGTSMATPAVTGTLVLDANLNKSGTGQLLLVATSVSGAGDININEGAIKFNAGAWGPLTASGAGKIAVNNSATLIFSRNSGTFNITRPIQLNNTGKIETGTGTTGLTTLSEIASDIEFTGANTITNAVNSASGSVPYRFTGVMSGTGTLTKNGGSALTLAGTSANTLSGQITVAAGELSLDKTGVGAVGGNILVTGGTLRINQPHQIADTSGLTLTGGNIAITSNRPETIASLTISSTATSSLSGLNVTGATAISSNAIQELNSGQVFTTHSLSLSNNAAIRPVGNATVPVTTDINVGAGGLTMNTGRIIFGNNGNASAINLNLAGDLVSTGASLFSATNNSGLRVIDLQGGSRSFAINDGTLEIRHATIAAGNGPSVQNGTLVKSGAGTLVLSRSQSTADFSLTEGPVEIKSAVAAGNVTLSGGSLLMDVGGASPAKLTTGDFTSTGGTIELAADNGIVEAGTIELVRYGGTLTGAPVINIPAVLTASRMEPVVDFGTGTDSSITITSTAVPLALTWHGAAAGGLWDNNNTANFNGGAEKFYALDSVTFNDSAANSNAVLDSEVIPADVLFSHGDTIPTYTLSGTGAIGGPAKLTKTGAGTTILATDNSYTGVTDILGGVLQVGNGGASGSLGSGAVLVDSDTTLAFSRSGSAVVGNTISGTGTILANGPGTVAFTANSASFTGDIIVNGGTLQFGDGGSTGSLGGSLIEVASGATFAVKRAGMPTITNSLIGAGALTIDGGDPILNGFNTHSGGVSVINGGTLRMPNDWVLGDFPMDLVTDAVRLNHGGLKNQNSDTVTDYYRGVTITGEAYFTADFSKSLTIGGPITGTGDIFINYDSGRVIFTDTTSDWQGVLTLGAAKPGFFGTTGGILEIDTINNGGVAGPLGIASADPANLVFNGGRLIYTGIDASTDRGFTLQNAGTVEVVAGTLTMSGVATGLGSFTKAGVGTLVLTNGSNDFIGEKIIAGGSLVMASTTALGDTGTFARFTGSTGILDLATDTGIAPYPLTIAAGNSGTILSNVATPGPGINHTFGNFELSNVVLNVAVGANVIGGDPRVTIPNLNLSAGAGGTLGLAPTTANLTVGTATIGSGNFAKTLALRGTETSVDNHVTGTISDGLNVLTLRKEGDSIWTISGDNTFTGNVVVDDGILVAAHSNALGDSNKVITVAGDANGGRIPELRFIGGISPTLAEIQTSGAGVGSATGVLHNISGDNTLTITSQVTLRTGVAGSTFHSDAGTFTINTPLVTANATNRFLTLAGPGNGVINGVIANGSTSNLPVTKNGTGTWALNGAHTYTGVTTVNEGTLSLGQAALSDVAAVVIGENGKLHLNFAGSDRVGSLTINGDTKPDGLYDSTTDPGFITGTGSIRVGPEPSGYGTWASGFPFDAGVNDGPNDDPDGDGIGNLLEYALGGVPVGAGASDTSILPDQSLTATDLVLTFHRSDSSETDVTLKVQWSGDMDTWTDFATIGPASSLPQVAVTEDSPTVDLDTVVVTIPRSLAPDGKLFARVQAVK